MGSTAGEQAERGLLMHANQAFLKEPRMHSRSVQVTGL